MIRIKRRAYFPVLLMAIVILTVSSIPSLSPPSINLEFEDKIAHFAEYSLLGFFAGRAIWITGIPKTRYFLFTALACSLFAILDEIHQVLIPNRTSDILDMAADILGATAGILLAVWRYGRKSRQVRAE